jgi:hypothetical protein
VTVVVVVVPVGMEGVPACGAMVTIAGGGGGAVATGWGGGALAQPANSTAAAAKVLKPRVGNFSGMVVLPAGGSSARIFP